MTIQEKTDLENKQIKEDFRKVYLELRNLLEKSVGWENTGKQELDKIKDNMSALEESYAQVHKLPIDGKKIII